MFHLLLSFRITQEDLTIRQKGAASTEEYKQFCYLTLLGSQFTKNPFIVDSVGLLEQFSNITDNCFSILISLL